MKIPARLLPLVEDGIIDEVLGQVKSGKEADVFVVRMGSETRCAKVYKEAIHRSFRQAAQYQEGRSVQNSRSARAMSRRSRYGQKEAETSWITAEVNALNALSHAGLRVPKPFGFFDGVLIMELIVDANGEPAPRLNDLALTPDTALDYHEFLIDQIVRMLCLGLIHGDLSEFNVLVDENGPVIIDLPQVVNAAGNNSAAMMFARDVNNMAEYFGRFEPGILTLKYAKEIWALFEKGKLTPHVELTGQFQEPTRQVDVGGVLSVIEDVRKERDDKLLKRTREREGQNSNLPPKRWNPRDEQAGNPPAHSRENPSTRTHSQGQRQPTPPGQHPPSHGSRPQPHHQSPRPQEGGPRPHSQGQRHPNSNRSSQTENRPQPPSQSRPPSQSQPKPQPQPQSQPKPQQHSPKDDGQSWGRRPKQGGSGKRFEIP